MDNKVFLDEAGLGEVGKVIKEHCASKDDIVNDLTTGGADKVLSAEQGKVLNDNKVDKSELSTKLPELVKDETKKLVSAKEKDTWNKKLDGNSDISTNIVRYTNYQYTNDENSENEKIIFDFRNVLKSVLSQHSRDIYQLRQATKCAKLVATLDKNKKIPIEQLPDEALKDTTYDLTLYAKKEDIKDKVDKKDGYGLSQNNFTNELLDKVNKIPEKHLTIERFPDGGDLYAVDKEGLYIVNVKTTRTPVMSAVAIWEQEAWNERQEYPLWAGYYALLVVFFEEDKKHLLLYDTLTSSAWEAHVPKDYAKRVDPSRAAYWLQHGNIGFNADDVVNLIQKIPQGFDFYPKGYEANPLSLPNELLEAVTLTYDENIVNVTLSSKDGATKQSGTFLFGATETSSGVMSASDKKKLNSIDIEKYAQQEKDIKSMKEEIALLKSQIEKLQASVNNKE